MKKIAALALVALGAATIATPALADPGHGRNGRAHNQGQYGYDRGEYGYTGRYTPGVVSYTDRDGDGYDDRDRNFNNYIDPWERSGNGYGQGGYNSNATSTDRNGDGFDDRDRNFNGRIDPWEYGSVRRR